MVLGRLRAGFQAEPTQSGRCLWGVWAAVLFIAASFCLAPVPVLAKSHHACVSAPRALSVHRTVEIDTLGGRQFGVFGKTRSALLNKGEVVLTFDDGPIPRQTGSILKTLRKHCAKATFFALGKLARAYPDVIARMSADGHTVANHGWNHRVMSGQSAGRIRYDIARTWHALDQASGGRAVPFFRFPYLASTPRVRRSVAGLHMAIFDTDIDSKDYRMRTPGAVVRRVMGRLKKRGKGILLFHDSKQVTAKALPQLLKALARNGYKLVHLTAGASVAPPMSALRVAQAASSWRVTRKRSAKKRRSAAKTRKYASKTRKHAAKKRRRSLKKRKFAAKRLKRVARASKRVSKRALRARPKVKRVRTTNLTRAIPVRKVRRKRGFSTARR